MQFGLFCEYVRAGGFHLGAHCGFVYLRLVGFDVSYLGGWLGGYCLCCVVFDCWFLRICVGWG